MLAVPACRDAFASGAGRRAVPGAPVRTRPGLRGARPAPAPACLCGPPAPRQARRPPGEEAQQAAHDSLLGGALQRRQIVFSVHDLEIEDQFTTHTPACATPKRGRQVHPARRSGAPLEGQRPYHPRLLRDSAGRDAVRCAMLVREQGRLDQVGEETVCLTPLVTDPVFI